MLMLESACLPILVVVSSSSPPTMRRGPLGNACVVVVDRDHKVAISCTITIAIPDSNNTCFGGTEDGTSVGCALGEAVELRKGASDVDAGNSLADVDAGEATCKNLATTSSGQIDDVTRTVCNVSKRVLGQFRGDCNSSQETVGIEDINTRATVEVATSGRLDIAAVNKVMVSQHRCHRRRRKNLRQ